LAGSPANEAFSLAFDPVWAEVEVSFVGGQITLKINNTPIISEPNTTAFTSGNVMLGYNDAYDSIGNSGAAVIYDNVRVVSLPQFKITKIEIVGSDVVIDFRDSTTGPFTVESAATADGAYGAIASTIVTNSPGNYEATVAYPGGQQTYYRISR
jgi:hypothetical protein